MAPLPYINDRSRFAAALNNALSASYGSIDGDIIQTAGFNSVNDGASLPLRLAASSTDTIDGIFTFPGKGGVLSFDSSNVFNGTAGTGRHKTLDQTNVNMKQIGADPTGIASASSAFQRALTALPASGEIFFPAGTYLAGDITIPNTKKMRIRGAGARILAPSGTSTILNIGADTTRDCPLEISNLCLDGADITDIIGMNMPIRTNTLLTGITFRRSKYGLNMMGYNTALNTCVFQGNVVGLRIYQDAVSGGGNANIYTNIEMYGNTIGFVMDGTATSALPCQSSVFLGGVIQNNSLCGAAFFQTSNNMFIGTHFEANSTGGTTVDVGGRTVRRGNIHINNSTLKIIHMSPAYTNPNIVMENGASVEIDGAEFYGSTTGPYINDLDGNCSAYFHGRCAMGTQARVMVRSLPDKLLPYSSFSFSSEPLVKHDKSVPNLMLTPDTPALTNAAGCTINANVIDDEQGQVSNVTYSASTGTTATNRVIISTGLGTVSTGDKVIISFLVKTSKDTNLVFELTDGNFSRFDYKSTDRDWRRIVMMVDAGTTNTPGLYIYPSDSEGATVYFSKMMVHRTPSGENDDSIQRVMKEGLFHSNSSPIVNQTLTADTAITLSLGYEEHFELHLKQDATGGHTVVWPNNAVFYGFPPQPTATPNSTTIVPFRIVDDQFICTQIIPSSTNYKIVQDGVNDAGNIPAITFPDAGTVMMRLKLGSATHASRTQGLQLAATGAGDTHYPYNDGNGYVDWLRTTRASNFALSGSITRTDYHWVIARTDSTDGWQFLQASDAGTLYSLATASHETVGTITTGKLVANTQFQIDRMIFFGSRLNDTDVGTVIASSATDALPEAPLARYEINFDPGTTQLHDSSGNDLHIPMTNTEQTMFQET